MTALLDSQALTFKRGGPVDLPVQDVVGAVAVAVGALVLNLLVLLLEIGLIMPARGP